MEKQQRQKDEDEMQDCTFVPSVKVRENNPDMHRTPIHERIAKVQQEKSELMQKLRAEVENEFHLTFAPEVNARSALIAESYNKE